MHMHTQRHTRMPAHTLTPPPPTHTHTRPHTYAVNPIRTHVSPIYHAPVVPPGSCLPCLSLEECKANDEDVSMRRGTDCPPCCCVGSERGGGSGSLGPTTMVSVSKSTGTSAVRACGIFNAYRGDGDTRPLHMLCPPSTRSAATRRRRV